MDGLMNGVELSKKRHASGGILDMGPYHRMCRVRKIALDGRTYC